ncbi:glutamate receptor ionotropic, kainate 2-like isoform X1 [Ostrinia furnacalis]|uniref:glutamate receptor ionotropic, kainate 2-like isoform X1 n=1 Tax=Ostrinia furnacalis TaxID=93504 RepID=UPI00103B75C3|nr:glutamate receptor ionotropic, kainate 2-like isoform X1 [Ostrinia furnacalis]
MRSVLVFMIIIKVVIGKDDFTINFIKSFIENERKPTHLIYNGLCWGKKMELNLVSELFNYGVRCSSSNLPRSTNQDHDLMFLVDLDCPDSEEVLRNASSNNLFRFPFRWLVLSKAGLMDHRNATLWKCPVLISSDLVLAEENEKEFVLTELYRSSPDGPMLSSPRGKYNGAFLDSRPHRELFRRRRDLMGHALVMANVIQDSNSTKEHLLKEDRLELQNDAAVKICWIAARHAFEMLNATRRHIFSYRWGYKVNGEWSGMIQDIKSNRADLATNCVLYSERLDVVTFTDMVAPLRMRFVFRQPPLAYVSNIFSLPFSSNVWVAIAVCTAASTLTLCLTSHWETKVEKNPTQLDGSISDALLLTLSAVAQQGCFVEPKRAPGRILEWFLFTALMALYAAYSANIVVLLQAPSNSIKSLSQLAASKITLAANDVDYSRFVLSPYKDPTHVHIYRRIMPEGEKPNFYHIHEGVEKIRQGLFAYHSIVEPVYRRIEETFLEQEKCDLTEVDFVNGFDAFTPVKKDSPYLEMLRVVYKQIREAGVQGALIKRFLVPKPRCVGEMSAFTSVGLLDIQPVLVFMVYGLLLSVLIAIGEIVVHKVTKRCSIKKMRKQ